MFSIVFNSTNKWQCFCFFYVWKRFAAKKCNRGSCFVVNTCHWQGASTWKYQISECLLLLRELHPPVGQCGVHSRWPGLRLWAGHHLWRLAAAQGRVWPLVCPAGGAGQFPVDGSSTGVRRGRLADRPPGPQEVHPPQQRPDPPGHHGPARHLLRSTGCRPDPGGLCHVHILHVLLHLCVRGRYPWPQGLPGVSVRNWDYRGHSGSVHCQLHPVRLCQRLEVDVWTCRNTDFDSAALHLVHTTQGGGEGQPEGVPSVWGGPHAQHRKPRSRDLKCWRRKKKPESWVQHYVPPPA